MKFLKQIFSNNKPDRVLKRNEPCWCGSGKKYKNCHLAGDQQNTSSNSCNNSG